MKTIAFTAAAAKDFDGLPHDDREQVDDALCNYAVSGHGDVKRLTGRPVSFANGSLSRNLCRRPDNYSRDLHWQTGNNNVPPQVRTGIMDEPQTIRTQAGEELVVLSRQDYDQLLSALAEAEEELADIATLDQRKSDWTTSGRQVLPTDVSRRLLEGKGRLQAIREWRGLARTAMAEKLQLDEALLARIEADRMPLDAAMAGRIAVLLDVPADWIAG